MTITKEKNGYIAEQGEILSVGMTHLDALSHCVRDVLQQEIIERGIADDYEKSVKFFEKTGICAWCGGSQYIVRELTEDRDEEQSCPVCNNL